MQLKQLNKVLITFSPWSGNARSAREFLARCTAPKALASNPDCKVETKLRMKGDPVIELEYINKHTDKISCGNMTVQQILDRIRTQSETMDTNERLREAGINDIKLESNWNSEIGRERDIGKISNGPSK